jgi:tetratricopeptide (TPR) repeat protein
MLNAMSLEAINSYSKPNEISINPILSPTLSNRIMDSYPFPPVSMTFFKFDIKKANYVMSEIICLYYNLSLLDVKKQDHKNAKKILDQGLKIDLNNESLVLSLAYHNLNSGRLEKTKNIFMMLVELYPNNSKYLSNLQRLNSIGL